MLNCLVLVLFWPDVTQLFLPKCFCGSFNAISLIFLPVKVQIFLDLVQSDKLNLCHNLNQIEVQSSLSLT
jgi:hypothetical protein